jgi:glycosyltransferase involved in cell wall biosynthesis
VKPEHEAVADGHGAAAPAPSRDVAMAVERPVRLAVVLPSLGAGGTERVVNVVANHWARQRGWLVTIVTLETPGTPPYYAFDPRVTIRRLGLPPGRRPKLSAAWQVVRRVAVLRRALREAAPDIVISFLTRTNIMAVLATRGMGMPVIVSERNNPELQAFGPVWNWLRARLYPRAFCLVTMTEGALGFFPPEMRERGRVIPNPVDLPANWRERRGGNVLAAVGRLVPQKGFDLLLQAFAEIAPRFSGWTLVIWGEGEERARLERQRDSLGLRDRVRFPGVSERPGVWVETADAFVLSSRYEGWGIVLLEAMAAGLPVVSFDCEWGPRDMVEDGVDGLLVPREDVTALARALAAVLGDPTLRARLGTTARASAQRFTPDKVAARWDEVVQDALGSGLARGLTRNKESVA